MDYQIRKMQMDDWPEVKQIYQQGIDTNLATFQVECPTRREWDEAHLKDCRLIIAEGVKILGWAALSRVSSRSVYAGVAEVSIYIDSEYRGRGIGKKLLHELVCCSERNGFWMLQASIMRENTASIRLHKSCGFRIVGYREKIGRDRFGTWRDTILMERRSKSENFGDA